MDFERGDGGGFVVDLDDAELRGRLRAGGDDDSVGDDLVQDGVVVQGEAVEGGAGGRGELNLREDLLKDTGGRPFGLLHRGLPDRDGPGLAVG